MKNFLKVAEVDVMPLLFQIQKQPHLWNQNSQRTTRAETAHKEVSDIWLRFQPLDQTDAVASGDQPHISVWYPAYYALPAARPIIFGLMARFEGEQLGGVLITKVPPGAKIDSHKDASWHVSHYEKFYVSLKSKPGANFYSEGEVLCPLPGEVWYFDNRLEHSVFNESDDDRITMIVCIHTQRFRG